MTRWLIVLAAAALLALASGCREEGPAEKAGRQIDEAVEELTGDDEGPLERAGRELDEAAEETADAVKDATN